MEVERVFSAKPERFKLNRKSTAAYHLKSAISDKLRHFLADYSDDVLAEYITVLVCNGKDQYQARDDLDAFLLDRAPEFVSWLWSHLFKYTCQTNVNTGSSHLKDATIARSGISDQQKGSQIERFGDFLNRGTVHPDHVLTKDENINCLSASAFSSVPSSKREFAEGSRHHPCFTAPIMEVKFSMVLSQTDGNKSLKSNRSGKRICTVIPGNEDQRILCLEKPKKYLHMVEQMVNSDCNGLPNKVSYLPKREPISRNLQSSASEYPCLKNSCANHVLRTSLSPRSVGALSRRNGNCRVSVWDRLGKPCDDTTEKFETTKACHIHAANLDEKVVNKQTLLLPVLNGEPTRSINVPGLEKNCGDKNPSKCMKIDHIMSIIHKPNTGTKIGRKRYFGEIHHGPATASVSLVGGGNNDLQCKEISQEFKKSILTSKDSKTSSKFVSEVLDVKQKLHQIEMEMSNLRSRQAEMRKDVKTNSSLHYGVVKHPEGDSEFRTVFVTNVHFAATEKSLSLYFSKCGVVERVVILTDKANAQRRRSAYVTFTSKEYVDKAVALCGTCFFSRIIKVVRKADATAMTTPAHHAPNTYEAPLSLQWRRDSASAPSKPSVQVSIEGKGINTSKQQEFPSSAVLRANSTTEDPAAI